MNIEHRTIGSDPEPELAAPVRIKLVQCRATVATGEDLLDLVAFAHLQQIYYGQTPDTD